MFIIYAVDINTMQSEDYDKVKYVFTQPLYHIQNFPCPRLVAL